jgi:hypothetical protein
MGSAAETSVDQAWSLRSALNRLWTDHVVWTRMYVVAAIADMKADAGAAANRLLQNQEHIGRAIVPFYGQGAGQKLTDLLKQHILIAVDLVDAAKQGDQARFAAEDAKWTSNAEEIASLLAGANPNWPKADVVDLLGQHLALTKNEAVARLKRDWNADVEAFDQIFTEILTVSGVLADGLLKQFHSRFEGGRTASPKATSLRLALARLWSDHVIWTRQYIVSAVADAPDTDTAATRLLKNQDDIGAAVGSVYGEAAGKRTTELLKQHIMIAVDIIDAAKKGEDARFADANAKWDRNAEEIAGFLSSANPNWPRADVTDLLMQHLNLTRKEVVARLQQNHDDDVQAFDQILTEILTVAEVLATGIIKQFPGKF